MANTEIVPELTPEQQNNPEARRIYTYYQRRAYEARERRDALLLFRIAEDYRREIDEAMAASEA